MKAYDLGDPQLSTIISVPVFIRHVATVPPDIGLGFSDDSYTIEIPENTPQGALVKMFSVDNGRVQSHKVPFRCSITSGNEGGNHFGLLYVVLFSFKEAVNTILYYPM